MRYADTAKHGYGIHTVECWADTYQAMVEVLHHIEEALRANGVPVEFTDVESAGVWVKADKQRFDKAIRFSIMLGDKEL